MSPLVLVVATGRPPATEGLLASLSALDVERRTVERVEDARAELDDVDAVLVVDASDVDRTEAVRRLADAASSAPVVAVLTDGWTPSGALDAGATDVLRLDGVDPAESAAVLERRLRLRDGRQFTPRASAGDSRNRDGSPSRTHQRFSERVARLHEGVTELQGCSTEGEILDIAITATTDILGFDWSCIAFARDGMFELVAVSADAPVDVGDRHLALDEGLAGEAFQSGESILIEDTRDNTDARPVDETFRSGISVPIDDIGVFQGTAEVRGGFDDDDLRLAELLVTHVTAALTRVQRETALREREAELSRQNERLEEFASVVSHDLRNPLNVASGNLSLVIDAVDDPALRERLETAAGSVERANAIVDDVLRLAREGRTIAEMETVSLDRLVDAAWATTGGSTGRLESTELGVIRCDPDRTRRLLENLFRNAVEHGSTTPPARTLGDAVEHGSTGSPSPADDAVEHGSTGETTATASSADDEERPVVTVRVGPVDGGFYVEDDGPGIDEDARDSVFEPGFSTAEDGTGFGLNIVREIVEAHGWEVAVGESPAGGARFEVTGVDSPEDAVAEG